VVCVRLFLPYVSGPGRNGFARRVGREWDLEPRSALLDTVAARFLGRVLDDGPGCSLYEADNALSCVVDACASARSIAGRSAFGGSAGPPDRMGVIRFLALWS